MATHPNHLRTLIEKIEHLPPERQAEVEDFVEFLSLKDQDRGLAHATAKVSEASFKRAWENPDDSAYDQL